MKTAPSFLSVTKQLVHHLLEDPGSKSREKVDFFLSLVVIAALLAVIRDTDPNLSAPYRQIHDQLETLFTGVFLIEYLLRWWVASDLLDNFRYSYRRHRRRHEVGHWETTLRAVRYALAHKWKWMRQPMAIIDLIACLPFFSFFRAIPLLSIAAQSVPIHVHPKCTTRVHPKCTTHVHPKCTSTDFL
ncbi:MAG: ion transporter [Magnetococcales bacterium]|nr:ion transporter [Magnetococcales bacterium]